MLFQRKFINLWPLHHTSLNSLPLFLLPLLFPFYDVGGNMDPARRDVHVNPWEENSTPSVDLGPVLLKCTSSKTPKGCPRGQDIWSCDRKTAMSGMVTCPAMWPETEWAWFPSTTPLRHPSGGRWWDSPRTSALCHETHLFSTSEGWGKEPSFPVRHPAGL